MTTPMNTLGSRLNSAQICRHNGWYGREDEEASGPGTELVALEGGMRRRLRLISIKSSYVVAVDLDVEDQEVGPPHFIDLTIREWVESL